MSGNVPAARRPSASLAFVLLLALPAAPQQPGASALSASVELGAEELQARLGLSVGAGGGFGLRLDADSRAAEARFFLDLAGDEKSALAFGPAFPGGVLRFLQNPVSASVLSSGPPVSVDRSMETGRSALMIGMRGAYAFAMGESEGPLLSFRRSSLAGGDEDGWTARVPEAAAAGLCLGRSGEGGGWSVEADACAREAREGGGGWSPDPRPDPGGRIAHAALLARRSSASCEAGAAIAVSAGRLEGSGLAARVRARGTAGPVSLNVSIGASGAAYRGLFGASVGEAFRCETELRLRLRRSSRISASLEDYAERPGSLAAPSWGWARSLAAALALGQGLSCAVAGTLEREPGGGTAGSGAAGAAASGFSSAKLSASVSRSAAGEGGTAKSRLSASAEWKRDESGVAMDGIDLAFEFSRENGGTRPSMSLRLKARIPAGGVDGEAAVARGGAELEIPLGRERRLTLELELPAEGVELGPLERDEEARALSFSIGYRASFPQVRAAD